MKILIAEDDIVCRMILAATLEMLGHEVVQVENGREAWEAIQREYFPVLISDWMMPGLDGLALTELIRSRSGARYTYVILLTALGGRSNYLATMDAGVDDFLTKPVDEEQLAARIRVAERIVGLQAQVKQLAGLLPICMYCKNIRDDQDYWQRIEGYISQHSEARFSHGICPECYEHWVKPELAELIRSRERVPSCPEHS
jgi:phosphoserine phosphatase RsbU/P